MTQDAMRVALLPCPFCGEEAFSHDGEIVSCMKEGCEMQWRDFSRAAWNTRSHQSREAEVQKLWDLLDSLQKAEALYRYCHDFNGADHINTGRAWDEMRRAGNSARQALTPAADDVERVAKAIFNEVDSIASEEPFYTSKTWDDLAEDEKAGGLRLARAALSAIEPAKTQRELVEALGEAIQMRKGLLRHSGCGESGVENDEQVKRWTQALAQHTKQGE